MALAGERVVVTAATFSLGCFGRLGTLGKGGLLLVLLVLLLVLLLAPLPLSSNVRPTTKGAPGGASREWASSNASRTLSAWEERGERATKRRD